MTERPPNPNTGDHADEEPVREESAPATPRWAKVFRFILGGLVLLFVILHLTGRGLGGH